jgi:predicted MFS family arabinose efflux permease
MASAVAGGRSGIGHQARVSTRIVFFAAGFATSAWAPLVPFAQARAALDEGMLGLLLLCLGVGSVATMSLAGALAARFGCRGVIIASAIPICFCLPVLATASSPLLLAAGLLVFGAGLGSVDVTMNIQAIAVERAGGQAMMSGFHGLFSIGGIAGASLFATLLGAGASPIIATSSVVVVIAGAVAVAARDLLPYGSKSEGPTFALPHGIVLFIGGLCFIAFLSEGAMLDWSAVFLTSARGADPAYAGLGYAVFSLTMTIGRLIGDRVVERCGGRAVIVAGGCCAALGFATATAAPLWYTTLLGFGLIGIGCANVVPVLYTSVGRQTVVPEHVAVSAITTLGYAGILAGPAAIGFAARATSLSMAFLFLALLQLFVGASARFLRV